MKKDHIKEVRKIKETIVNGINYLWDWITLIIKTANEVYPWIKYLSLGSLIVITFGWSGKFLNTTDKTKKYIEKAKKRKHKKQYIQK